MSSIAKWFMSSPAVSVEQRIAAREAVRNYVARASERGSFSLTELPKIRDELRGIMDTHGPALERLDCSESSWNMYLFSYHIIQFCFGVSPSPFGSIPCFLSRDLKDNIPPCRVLRICGQDGTPGQILIWGRNDQLFLLEPQSCRLVGRYQQRTLTTDGAAEFMREVQHPVIVNRHEEFAQIMQVLDEAEKVEKFLKEFLPTIFFAPGLVSIICEYDGPFKISNTATDWWRVQQRFNREPSAPYQLPAGPPPYRLPAPKPDAPKKEADASLLGQLGGYLGSLTRMVWR